MNKQLFLSLITVMICFLTACNRQPAGSRANEYIVGKQTYTFAIKGADTLRLDKYELQNI